MIDPNSTFILLSVILLLSTYTDVKKHLIPNMLSLGGVFIGLSMNSYQTGFDGFLFGLGGLAVGFFLFIPFYLLKGMAAGDVKLMAAIGAFMGPSATFTIVIYTLVCGAALALIYLVLKNGGKLTFLRYANMIKTFVAIHKWVYIKPERNDIGKLRFPYASAILVGTFTGTYFLNNTLPFYT